VELVVHVTPEMKRSGESALIGLLKLGSRGLSLHAARSSAVVSTCRRRMGLLSCHERRLVFVAVHALETVDFELRNP
jgi:hypothetical protein